MIKEAGEVTPYREGSRDEQIQATLCERLGSGHRMLRAVHVRVDPEGIRLSGSVPTFYLKQIAQETARQVCPNRRVYNELIVVSNS